MAARAPSVHNTQPWRFTVSQDAIELYADPRRQLLVDPDGREMLVSCGAALYGLRLAVRSLGYLPDVELLPGPGTPRRHTHRGSFEPGPLPAGLLSRLQDDVRDQGATLIVIDSERALRELAAIVAAAGRRQDHDPQSRAELREWSHAASSPSRDGVPAHAFPATPAAAAGPLPQRDFDLGRGIGLLTPDGPAAPVTLALFSAGDGQLERLQAGQALHRLLLHAASKWVFARLNTQPLEDVATRALLKDRLIGTGALQCGDQLYPGGLQPVRDDPGQPPGQLIAELLVGCATCPHRSRVELEGLDRADCHGAEGPLIRREQPRPAEQLA